MSQVNPSCFLFTLFSTLPYTLFQNAGKLRIHRKAIRSFPVWVIGDDNLPAKHPGDPQMKRRRRLAGARQRGKRNMQGGTAERLCRLAPPGRLLFRALRSGPQPGCLFFRALRSGPPPAEAGAGSGCAGLESRIFLILRYQAMASQDKPGGPGKGGRKDNTGSICGKLYRAGKSAGQIFLRWIAPPAIGCRTFRTEPGTQDPDAGNVSPLASDVIADDPCRRRRRRLLFGPVCENGRFLPPYDWIGVAERKVKRRLKISLLLLK